MLVYMHSHIHTHIQMYTYIHMPYTCPAFEIYAVSGNFCTTQTETNNNMCRTYRRECCMNCGQQHGK